MFLLLMLLIFGSCSESGKDGMTTKISGYFPEFKGKKVTLSEIDIDKATPIDTTEISSSGHFSFKFKRTGPGFFLVKTDNKNYITLVLDKEKKVEVSSQNALLRKGYTVEGSPDSELYSQFELFLETNRRKVDSLTSQFKDYQKSTGFQSMKLMMDEDYKKIFNAQHEYAVAFIENHCQSLATLLVINRRFGERKIMDEEKDYIYYFKVDSCLSTVYPGNKNLLAFKKRVDQMRQRRQLIDMENKKLAPGNKAPDITLGNPSGKEVSLYSLAGSPVIIYFWSSTEQASRAASQVLKNLLTRTSVKNIKVYAIALENYKEMWSSAIDKDGISGWINVTDFLGTHSGATSLYGFPDEYPYVMLLDKDLNIIYRGNDLVKLESNLANLNR